MERLIDAEEAYKVLTDYYHQRTEIQHRALKEAIGRVPSVDAEPVKHGHWVNKGFEPLRCSECGIVVDTYNGIPWAIKSFRYCPYCGAKMDEVEENE